MLRRLRRLVSGSLRYKLLVMVVVPVLLIAPATLGFAIWWSRSFSYAQLLRQVSADLGVAHDAFVRLQRDYLQKLELLANSYSFQAAYAAGDHARLQDQITTLKDTTGFDFLHLTDLKGRWILDDGSLSGASSLSSPLIQKAARWGQPSQGVEVYSRAALQREGEVLAERARMPVVATPRATPTDRRHEDRALVVRTIYPVRDLRGSVVALLDGGVLLNRNFGFVDAIRDLVYGPDSLPEGSRGAVTVLLDDVRISTNVPLQQGERALGTRVSDDVYAKVIGQGNTWIDRAFVVNDWYLSGYEPIIDVYGKRVGMLYTGFLERPFSAAYYDTIAILLLMLLLGTGLTALLAIRGARSIFRPIEVIATVVRSIQLGERRRIGPLASHDEIGELARQFDAMLDLLEQRSHEIREAAEKLESKVEERTSELRHKNLRLQETIDELRETQRQLAVAEKLAALGELTAGVAHEINNPAAVIQGNLEILREELGEHVEPVRTEVELIFDQVERIRAIVEKLLRYSRPTEFRGRLESVDVREVIGETLVLVRHELERARIGVRRTYAESGRVAIDRQELQQVLVNLFMNAAQAMEPGGTLRLTTSDWEDRGVRVDVADDGCGIAPENIGRVFDPFFTTRRKGGTGLGLSVSYALVRRYGGDLTVASEPGRGATFTLYLLREPDFTGSGRHSGAGRHGLDIPA